MNKTGKRKGAGKGRRDPHAKREAQRY
jgi:hypothetical protein